MTDIRTLFEAQRAYFATGATLPLAARKRALQTLHDGIRAHEREFLDALHTDLGKSDAEGFQCEVGLSLSEISYLRKHLRSIAKPKRHLTGLANFPARTYTVSNPYGCTLILAPWNYPVLLTLEPLAGALAAGNCAILKPSAYAPATSALLAKVVSELFPPEYVAVVEGGRQENSELLELPFDYIFFTGGVQVGKLVMEKAAAHLTPFTLELGGKSPCIVDKTADLALAARRIAFGKFLNCGQTCVAPDYLLVDASVKEAFLAHLCREIRAQFGKAPLDNPHYGKIINRKHFDRLSALLSSGDAIIGGEVQADSLRIAPTVLDNVRADAPIMQEEIFGPLLPVLSYRSEKELEEILAPRMQQRTRPLACYLFTRDKNMRRRFREQWQFGGGCINDTIIHLANSRVPFGGVGSSGIGQYHGRESFRTFSHVKSVVRRGAFPDVPVRYQPYSDLKTRLLHIILR